MSECPVCSGQSFSAAQERPARPFEMARYSPPLSETYDLFQHIGRAGFGDFSEHIPAGRIGDTSGPENLLSHKEEAASDKACPRAALFPSLPGAFATQRLRRVQGSDNAPPPPKHSQAKLAERSAEAADVKAATAAEQLGSRSSGTGVHGVLFKWRCSATWQKSRGTQRDT